MGCNASELHQKLPVSLEKFSTPPDAIESGSTSFAIRSLGGLQILLAILIIASAAGADGVENVHDERDPGSCNFVAGSSAAAATFADTPEEGPISPTAGVRSGYASPRDLDVHRIAWEGRMRPFRVRRARVVPNIVDLHIRALTPCRSNCSSFSQDLQETFVALAPADQPGTDNQSTARLVPGAAQKRDQEVCTPCESSDAARGDQASPRDAAPDLRGVALGPCGGRRGGPAEGSSDAAANPDEEYGDATSLRLHHPEGLADRSSVQAGEHRPTPSGPAHPPTDGAGASWGRGCIRGRGNSREEDDGEADEVPHQVARLSGDSEHVGAPIQHQQSTCGGLRAASCACCIDGPQPRFPPIASQQGAGGSARLPIRRRAAAGRGTYRALNGVRQYKRQPKGAAVFQEYASVLADVQGPLHGQHGAHHLANDIHRADAGDSAGASSRPPPKDDSRSSQPLRRDDGARTHGHGHEFRVAGGAEATPCRRPTRGAVDGGAADGEDETTPSPAVTSTPLPTGALRTPATSLPPHDDLGDPNSPNYAMVYVQLLGKPKSRTVKAGNFRGGSFQPSAPPSSRADLLAENATLRAELHLARRAAEAAKGEALWKSQAAEELRLKRVRENRREVAAARTESRRASATHSHELAKAQKKLAFAISQRDKQAELLFKQRESMKEMVSAQAAIDEQSAMQEQLDAVLASKRVSDDEVAALEELLVQTREHEATVTDERDANSSHASKLLKVQSQFQIFREECGVFQQDLVSVPPREPGSTSAEERGRQHMAAVLSGRGEGTNINLIADALHRCGYLKQLLTQADRCQPLVKAIVKEVVGKVQNHWTPRHAVQVWDRLELTRAKMETLRHLLSHVYDPVADKYVPIRVWQNPNYNTDFVLTATLASRWAREQEFSAIAKQQNIVVSANGRCERDAVMCTERLYSNYSSALRKIYTVARPAQPVLFLDGTGGALGRGICHGEMGCADFIAVGESDAKQSRATLQPLFLYEGTDHAGDLRSELNLVWTSYNKLVEQGSFTRWDRDDPSVTEVLPCRAMTAADMQGAKSEYGMAACSHSVWCKCQRGEGGPQHRYPSHTFVTYEQMLTYIEDEVGCQIKTHDELCSWAHYSPGVAKGGRFTKFRCSCCRYEPTEAQWRKDLADYALMTDDQRKLKAGAHFDRGDEMNSQAQHYHQQLFTPPLPNHGMERCGVDNLHLVYLNLFKHLWRYTIHENLPKSKQKLIHAYCKAAGFYSYDAAADDEDPTKHWIGREVKRFLVNAHLHLPFLLQVASAPIDSIPELAQFVNGAGEEEMEDDDMYAPTDAEVCPTHPALPSTQHAAFGCNPLLTPPLDR